MFYKFVAEDRLADPRKSMFLINIMFCVLRNADSRHRRFQKMLRSLQAYLQLHNSEIILNNHSSRR